MPHATFDAYLSSLDHLTTVAESREDRIAAAWRAGGGRGPVPQPLTPSPYLYAQLREAFRLGAERA